MGKKKKCTRLVYLRYIVLNHLSIEKYEDTVGFQSVNIFLLFTIIPYIFHSILSFPFYLVGTKTQNSSAGETIKHFFAERKKLIWLNSTILWELLFKNYRNISGLTFSVYEFGRRLVQLFQLLAIPLWKLRLSLRVVKVQCWRHVMCLLKAVAHILHGMILLARLLLSFPLFCFWELIVDFIYSCFLSLELSSTAICWPGGLSLLSLCSFSLPSHMLCLPKSWNSGCLALKLFLFLC